ncbi:PolC-type DNA polymerase III [Oenococcus kitaharae]|uniref:DNA polymerase III PolC-type n=1 Tax=Oenococcus kitaharae DSM 17330 TaxID=1045004 RepID=G9WH59_9LACO|nr:PolC-type DNA polymerase III [Oenococcus kitaharae]EHN59548.1 DNA polymerase III alpha subunit [Oenococcus kitaharae DSM 17330]OEY83401.1 DNA polymerase III [Oenococcus kitaharae]OEY85200.1 DNA polymerase III [Oenococcus kitaharae]OEY86054.1 DNA polymerase III [Oenococcus kitaharae]
MNENDSKLKILLEQIGHGDDQLSKKLDGAVLQSVLVDPDERQWVFSFTSDHFLLPTVLGRLIIDTKDTFVKENIHCVFQFQVAERAGITQLGEYWHLVLSILDKNTPFTNEISAGINFADTGSGIEALLTTKAGVSYFTNLHADIIDIYKKLGVDLPFTFNVDSEKQAEIQEQFETSQAAEIHESAASVAQLAAPEISTNVLLGNAIPKSSKLTPIDQVSDGDNVVVEGYVYKSDYRETRRGGAILTIEVTDYTNSISAKVFSRNAKDNAVLKNIPSQIWVKIRGRVAVDDFMGGELSLNINDLQTVKKEADSDPVPEGKEHRIELHAHTTMTALNAVNSASELFDQAAQWQQPALAITDNADVQAFPEAAAASAKTGVKAIYGLEANFVADGEPIAINTQHEKLSDSEYTIFDIETTGLSAVSDKIIQLSAVKMKHGTVLDTFDEFINPGFPLSEQTINLTGITDDLVRNSKPEAEVLSSFQDFYKGTILAGHNVIRFDYGFVNHALVQHQLPKIDTLVLDTLNLARWLYPNFGRYTLDFLSKKFNVNLEHHHRAIDDSTATGMLLHLFLKEAEEKYGIVYDEQLNEHTDDHDSWRQTRPTHLSILVKNQIGLKNLYKLVSESNVNYYYRVSRVPKSLLTKYHEGLLVGSGDVSGELFDTLAREGLDKASELADRVGYDYIEVQPLENYQPRIESGFIKDDGALRQIIRDYVNLAEMLKKPLVVTGDVHYVGEKDRIYRTILLNSKIARSSAGGETRYRLADLSMKKTQHLLDEFSFLGEDKAYEIVVENSHKIADSIDDVQPLKKGLSTPKIEGSEEILRQKTFARAKEMYGDPLPDIIQKRLDRELNAIIGNGYAVIYVICQRLVDKSNKDGYIVGSRGSVGSSLVATMMGITEVNPLPPHYRSRNGNYTEFVDDDTISSGFDLPEKRNPIDGTLLIGDGQNIPFETFLGFKGDKVPDIDLNFSGDYQPIAHNYTKVMFGENNVFRAGTIGTVAEKTAYGMVKNYEESEQIHYRKAEEDRLSDGITGVKRTTGQHAGGIIIIPANHDVYDFTPIQFPADDTKSNWKTTHLDYHSIHDNVLKMDILGHDDPTLLRALQDMSGIDPKTIPVNDSGVLSLFTSTKALGVTAEEIMSNTGTLGIPEFGTNFVRGMLEQTKPHNFGELLQISGLSHGTNVWNGNADELIKAGQANIGTVIGTRDKIMTDLMSFGLDSSDAFQIMEKVRKGKGISDEHMAILKAHPKVPNWYIESMQKIQYMFPRAHAAAYVTSALRIAYFKVYFPAIYYAAYFSVRAKDKTLDAVGITQGKNKVQALVKSYRSRYNDLNKEESKTLAIYEIANEAWQRGIEFKMVDLYESEAFDWKIKGNQIILPFITLPGLGDNVAKAIVAARAEHDFISKEDLAKRGSVNKTLIDFMDQNHMLDGMTDANQMDLFAI